MTATLNPLAIALDGLGFGVLRIAVDGLLPEEEPEPPGPPPIIVADAALYRRPGRRRKELDGFILGNPWLM
jgi:hypothetical protein